MIAGCPEDDDALDHGAGRSGRAAPCRPARRPCTRRTSRANSRRPRRCASRAHRGRPPRGEGAGQVRRGGEASSRPSPPGREPGRDLLQQPAVAVRVAERRERPVAVRSGAGPLTRPSGRRLELAPAREVEDLADLDAARRSSARAASMSETISYRSWADPGAAERDARAEVDRAGRAGRRHLDHVVAVPGGEVGVEPPAEPRVERLGALDVGDGDGDDLELHVHLRDLGRIRSLPSLGIAVVLIGCLLGRPLPSPSCQQYRLIREGSQ